MFDGTCLWVGLTGRTNAQAVDQLREVLGDQVTVVGLPVCDPEGRTLHLKVEVWRERMSTSIFILNPHIVHLSFLTITNTAPPYAVHLTSHS